MSAAKYNSDKPHFTVAEAADYLGVSPSSLRRWDSGGILSPQRTAGGQRRYTKEQLDNHLNKKLESQSLLTTNQSPVLQPIQPQSEVLTELEEYKNQLTFLHQKRSTSSSPSLFSLARISISSLPLASRIIFLSSIGFVILSTVLASGYQFVLTTNGQGQLFTIRQHGINKDVLADTTQNLLKTGGIIAFNIPAIFNGNTTFEENVKIDNKNLDLGTGQITAANILYGVAAGSGLSVEGGQNPTISSSDTLALVTGRGATTTTAVTLSGGATIGNALNLGQLSSEPSGTNGAIYYNKGSNKFRCYQNGAWKDCISTSAFSSFTLAGTSGTSQSVTDGATVTIAAGNGISTTASSTDTVTVGLTLPTSGTSSNSSANSGLETSSSGLSLLRGCSDSQVLAWNASSSVWKCAASGSLTGSGTANSLAKFTTSTNIGNSTISDDGTNVSMTGNLGVNGGSLTTTATTANLFNATATTLNIGGAATTINIGPTGAVGTIVLSGGSSDTGCTLDGTTGNLTCTGNITGGTTGTAGYWQRSGTTLSPATSGDSISFTGTLNTNTFSSTAITFAGTTPVISASTASTSLSVNPGSNGNLLLAGGSGSNGCTLDSSSGNFTCKGNITGGSSGSQGYWQRSGTTLSPVTSGDSVSTSGNITASGTGTITAGGLVTAQNGFTLSTGSLSLTSSAGSGALTLTSSSTAWNVQAGLFDIDTSNTRVGIGTQSPNNRLEVLSTTNPQLRVAYDTSNYATLGSSSAGAITLTTAGTTASLTLSTGANNGNIAFSPNGTGAVQITSGVTSGTTTSSGLSLSANSLNTGTGLYIASSSLTSGKLVDIEPTFAGSAVTGYATYLNGADSTANANTDYMHYSTLALSGNAAKNGYGFYSTVTTSSTTADTIYSLYGATSVTGAISTGTRYAYGFYAAPASTAANTGGTSYIYGGYFAPSSTSSTTGSTVNVYGLYSAVTATLTTGGTINGYGAYIKNPSMNATGTSTNYGLYVENISGAANNYAAVFAGGNVGIGTTTPAYKLDISTAAASDRGVNIANTASSGTNYGLYAAVTGAATSNTGGYFQATGATTDYGIQIAALTGATSTGVSIGNLSGTTSDTGISVGTISGSGATGTGVSIGNISTTGANNIGISLGTLTGGTASNYQLSTGTLTAIASTTDYHLNLGTTVGASSATFGGINIGAISGAGTTSYGINLGANSSTATTNYGLNIGAVSGAGTNNYGLNIGAVSGAGTGNFAISTAQGQVSLTDNSNTNPSLVVTNNTITTLGAGVTTTGMTNLQSTSLTTGNLINAQVAANTLTTGTLLNVSTTSTALAGTAITGQGLLGNFDWSPGSSTTATGDLFRIHLGSNALVSGNVLDIVNNTSSIFSVNPQQFTTSLPAALNAAGDVSVAYDINFTNPTSSFIKSQAPIIIQSGETFNSSNLTLKTFNQGTVVFDESGVTTGTAVDMTNFGVTTGKGVDLEANSLTTGTLLNLSSSATAQTTGTLLSITQSGTTTGFTGNTVSITGSSTTGTGNLVSLTSVNTTNGAALSVTSSSLTTGNAVSITAGGATALTSGQGVLVTGPTGAAAISANSGLVKITAAGALTTQTGAGSGGLLDVQDNAIITGTLASISDTAVMTGNGNLLTLTANSATTTTGLLTINGTGLTAGTGNSIYVNSPGAIKGSNVVTGGNSNSPSITLEGNGFTAGPTNTTGSFSVQAQPASATTAKLMLSVTGWVTTANLYSWDQAGNVLSKGTDINSSTPDVAENIPVSDQTIAPGDVVSVDPNAQGDGSIYDNFKAKKSSSAYDNSVLGVISTDPGVILHAPTDAIDTGQRSSPTDRLLTIAGRTPVNVSMENGLIQSGDYLTASSTPGVAMKAIKAGVMIGKALESYSGTGIGQILALVNVGWYDPSVYIANNGNLVAPTTQTPQTSNNAPSSTTYTLSSDPSFTALQSQVSSVSAQLISLRNQVTQQASQSAFLTTATQSAILTQTNLTNLNSLDAQIATVSATLNVIGRTTLADLGITGTITSGVLTITGLDTTSASPAATINTLSGPLMLQNTAINGIDIADGAVTIDTKGNITTQGRLTAAEVSTQKLTITTPEVATDAAVLNASESAVLAASIGTAAIPAGQTTVTVQTNSLTPKSLIFTTPNQPVAVGTKPIDAKTFMVTISQSLSEDLKINWWVIN